MKKPLLIISLVLALLFPTTALATPKTGAACKKIGSTQTYSGKKFTCVKSGKKFVWNKGVLILKPTPTPTPTKSLDPTRALQGQSCLRNSGDVIGYDTNKHLVILMCNQWDDRYFPRPNGDPVDQVTGKILLGPMGTMMQTLEYKSQILVSSKPVSSITEVSKLATVDQCKIPDAGPLGEILNNSQRHFVSGFPIYPERAVLTKNPTVQVIAIDFPDLQGSNPPAVDLKETTIFVSDFYQKQATKAVSVNWSIPEKYFRMPKTIAEYDLGGDIFKGGFNAEKSFSYVREAISQVDPTIDFSGASIIAVVVPPQVTRMQIGTFVAQAGEPSQPFVTNERNIYNVLIMGGPAGAKNYELLNWAHEMGHMFGMTDLRDASDPTKQDSSDLGVFDLMNSMVAPELLAWQRFILGILNDNQIRCTTSTFPTTHFLVPVEMITSEPKMVVIPISKYRAVIVESRRNLGYDTTLGSLNEGAIVYTLDTTIRYGKSPLKIIPSPTSTDATWRKDAALKVNESVTIWGYKITNIESGAFGDVVKVEKVG